MSDLLIPPEESPVNRLLQPILQLISERWEQRAARVLRRLRESPAIPSDHVSVGRDPVLCSSRTGPDRLCAREPAGPEVGAVLAGQTSPRPGSRENLDSHEKPRFPRRLAVRLAQERRSPRG